MGLDIISYSEYGIAAFHNSKGNMGISSSTFQGNNVLFRNNTGIYNSKSQFYLEEGYNDVDNEGLNIYTYYSNGVKARYNWWGSNDENQIRRKFNEPDNIVYDNWCSGPNMRSDYARDVNDYQIAEGHRLINEWTLAVPLYMNVYNDSINSIEDYLSITGIFNCYQNLYQLDVFRTWITSEIETCSDIMLRTHMKNTLALANRSLGEFQAAIDYYEGILDNNPSYEDSCFAVIDLGFTWLEADLNIRGRYMQYKPRSMQEHMINTERLLNSILTNENITTDDLLSVIPILHQNYPNPFNPNTTISFSVPVMSNVKINIYNIKGQLVKELIDEPFERGLHRVVWEGHSNTGSLAGSGIYLIKMTANGKTDVRKAMMIK
jgi:tetratricopeptide (TPR) repeat protein